MTINSFRWLPPSLSAWLQSRWKVPDERSSTPFTPLAKPVAQMRLALVTTGGLYLKGKQTSFDLAREEQDPDWGDPSYRTIPSDTAIGDIGVAHKHYNPVDIEQDFNVLIPMHRVRELVEAGEAGSLAPSSYSVMGYQGHPGPVWGPWRDRYGPEMLARMKSEGVEGVLLTPA